MNVGHTTHERLTTMDEALKDKIQKDALVCTQAAANLLDLSAPVQHSGGQCLTLVDIPGCQLAMAGNTPIAQTIELLEKALSCAKEIAKPKPKIHLPDGSTDPLRFRQN